MVSVAVVAAVITTVISLNIVAVAAPTFTSGKIIAGRTAERTEDLQDPIKRAEYVSIPTLIMADHQKLREVLDGADATYESASRAKGYSPNDPAYEVIISEEEANALISALPAYATDQKNDDTYVSEFHRFKLESEGKYYVVTVVTVGTK